MRRAGANWRRRFFYAAEAIFAIIAGLGEAAIYYAYLPPSLMRWPEAIARATITQLAIILFGVAAVEAAKRARTLAGKIVATMPANLATGVFSLVAFWFLRDAAIIYRDGSTLAPAEAFSFTLPIGPNGLVLTGQEIDIYLVAALPLFQVMLNWLAPIIVQDAVVESEDARHEREARELANLAHEAERQRALAEIGAAKAAGRRRTVLAYAGREKQPAAPASLDAPDGDDAAGPDGGGGGEETRPADGDDGDRPPENAPAATVTAAKRERSQRNQSAHLVPSGMWTATDLARYVRATYHVEMTDDAAVAAMAQLPHVERLAGVKGNPYGAPKREVRAWADRKFEQPTLRLTAG